ncbi:hypothetical protein GOP47_0016549 [Adiantum capillus-veneris]|uniref:Uncharacterized protein n=1 Tax=Adiantum capillus-veneris TaxID=13818 RepID=A0A9D4UIP5_ADICA|nr:hypothetical protein GOP47_0016549 [Adiantum capillus-veneris]
MPAFNTPLLANMLPSENGLLLGIAACVLFSKERKRGSILLLAAGSAETPASRGLQRRDESARGDLCRAEVQDMADGVSGKYTIKIPKNVYERQLYYQSKIGNYTHMKGPFDKIVSFIVPLAIGTTAAAMMGRGLWNLSNGTGKKE